MTSEQLISKAKEHAEEFIHLMPNGQQAIDGPAKARDDVVVYFGDGDDPALRMTFDKETGDFIDATSHLEVKTLTKIRMK